MIRRLRELTPAELREWQGAMAYERLFVEDPGVREEDMKRAARLAAVTQENPS